MTSNSVGCLFLIVLIFLGPVSSAWAQDGDAAWPGEKWSRSSFADAGLNEEQLLQARDYALTGGGAGFITRGGRLVLSWGDVRQRFDLKSTTKSIGVTSLGLAISDGRIALSDKVVQHHSTFGIPPEENRSTRWLDEITILHLATQTAGFEKPGGYRKLIFEPGTKWSYSDGGPNWLAECVTLAYERDVDELMFERVFTTIGIGRSDLVWRNNSYRDRRINGVARREFGSGISANVSAMARIGLLYLREGVWHGTRILPADFVERASHTVPEVVGLPEVDPKNYGNASDHYGLLWWNNADGTLKNVPRDAYWSWGLYESLIVVIPSLDIVVARAGKSWKREWAGHYDVLQPFLEPIAAAAGFKPEEQASLKESSPPSTVQSNSPYPQSKLIAGIDWAPAASIVRKARGGDNWPTTWADDGDLYTAYGDGRGFEPYVDRKLSMGLCRVSGSAADFAAVNLRSASFESVGDGRKAKKASGLLMVDGVLFVLARNAGNSQLGWSRDHGKEWTWSDWRFTDSFGYPTFVNFGRNYDGARDNFVYVVSHDQDSAYESADGMVMARVDKKRITDREAWQFFSGTDDDNVPRWTKDVSQRAHVFRHPGRCYRSGMTFNAGVQRYLWCQTIPGPDTRFEGGFAIYDAPEPWGPWSTVYSSEHWDVGPGETSSIPSKWISRDGETIRLVFSGDDCFSVRRGTLRMAD
jgi:CubicO group peptidase (beta-lactamase class C family)